MKAFIQFCFFVSVAAASMAAPVLSPVPKSNMLLVEFPFENLAPGNVSVRGAVTKQSGGKNDFFSKTLKVDVTGVVSPPAYVEAYLVVERNLASQKGEPRILVAGQGRVDRDQDTFEFEMKNSHNADAFKGWFVRVIQAGRIIGMAASSPSLEKFAADLKTQIRYGER